MNAQLKPRTEDIEIALIDFDIKNDRHGMDKTKLAELAESIRIQGLQQPISVYEKDGGRYSMGFGHRRLAAHQLLELTSISAIIHPAASNAEIRSARAIENLQRDDLTPLEEAESVEALAETHGGDVEAVGAAIGRTARWVENRLALLRLSPRVRQILTDGDLTLAHAQLIARLPDHVKQDEIAGYAAASKSERGWPDEPAIALSELRAMIERELRDLNTVPWQLEAEFAGKPACAGCPHNSNNQPQLFDGDTPKKPLCLDASCFGEKSKFASLAVRRASNTLTKETSSRTAKAAAEAAEKREAAFLKPKAVLDAADRMLKPEKKTKAEKKGREQGEADKAAEAELHKALNNWYQLNGVAIAAALNKQTLRTACFLLLAMHPDFELIFHNFGVGKKKREEIKQHFAKQFGILKQPTAEILVKLALDVTKAIQDSGESNEFFPLDEYPHTRDDWFMEQMRELFGLTFTDRPKRQDFVKKVEPKAKVATKENAGARKIATKGKTKKKVAKK